MVKLIVFLKRRPGMSVEEFREHWRDRHGPLVRSTTEMARHVVSYEQLLPAESWLPIGTEFDGVTIMTFAEVADLEAFVQEPAYGEVIAPDEQSFLDMEDLVGVIVEEPTVVIPGTD